MILEEFRKKKVGIVALCSYGRSGTSFCMQILRAAGVTVLGEFPFEQRTAQAGMLHWLRQGLSEAGQLAPPKGFGHAGFRGGSYVSPLFAEALNYDDVVKAQAALADRIAATGPPGRRWLGEKFLGFDVLRMCRTFDAGDLVLPLFLLRDPRDIFQSVKRFNARRGQRSFQDNGDDDRLLRLIVLFLERQLAEQKRLGGVIVRYEALIAPEQRDAALRDLLQHLRIPAPPPVLAGIWAQIDAGRASVANHITGNPAEAVDPAYAAIFAAQAAALARVGYPAKEAA